MASRAFNLYRSILRAHSKYLSFEMKELGDAYVKSEFRQHKSVTKKEHLDQFFSAWEQYLDQILMTARAKEAVSTGALDAPEMETFFSDPFEFGRNLPEDVELTDEQVAQLNKLREEVIKTGKPLR
jgi:Complex1_LYR-like